MLARLVSSGAAVFRPAGSGNCASGEFPTGGSRCLTVGWFPEGCLEYPWLCQIGALR